MAHRPLVSFSSCILFLVAAQACGSSRPPTSDGGTPTDGGMATDAGQCPSDVVALEGMPCTTEGLFCGPPCPDICRFCVRFRCEGGTWMQLEAGPAPCFDCGSDLRCVERSQYCDITTSDVPGTPGTYECVALPSACTASPSCACVEMTVTFDECSEDSSIGAVTVTHFGG